MLFLIFQRRGRYDPHVVAQGHPRRQRRRAARHGVGGHVEQPSALVELPRIHGVSHGHGAGQRRRVDRPLDRQIRVHQRPHPLGKSQPHVLAGQRHVDAGRLVTFDVNPPAEPDRSSTDLRGHFVEADAARIESHGTRNVFERVRQVEMADTSVVDVHDACHDGIAHRTVERRFQRGAPGAANVRDNPLKNAESGVAGRAHRNALVVQIDSSRDVELRLVAYQPQFGQAYRVAVERDANRRGVAQPVVEQPHIQAVDRRLHHQLVDVGELSDHTDVAAGDGGREGRQLRVESAEVWIERRVGHVERQVGIHPGRECHPAGPRYGQPGRRRLELHGQQVAVDVQRGTDLSDALIPTKKSLMVPRTS